MKKALFCLGLFLLSAALQAQSKWTDEGCYDISWYDKDAETYSISSASQLAGLAYLVNNATDLFEDKVVELTADIDLAGKEWVPIGDNDQMVSPSLGVPYPTAFCGTFDGKEHTVSNIQIDVKKEEVYTKKRNWVTGLFGESKGEIKNLHMNLGIIQIESPKNDWSYKIIAGGICGKAKQINRCSSSVNLNIIGAHGEPWSGGIVGEGYAEYCTYNGELRMEYGEYAGGIVGYGNAYHCENNGKVSAYGHATNTYIGGITGASSNIPGSPWSDQGYGFVNHCVNRGQIFYEGISGYAIGAGGVSGCADFAINCSNYGQIHVEAHCYDLFSNNANVSGICGLAHLVRNSVNEGKVSANADNGRASVSGINSCSYGYAVNCFNTGDITLIDNGYLTAETAPICTYGAEETRYCYFSNEEYAHNESIKGSYIPYTDMCKPEFASQLNEQAYFLSLNPLQHYPTCQPGAWQVVTSQAPQLTNKDIHTLSVKVEDQSGRSPQYLNYTCEAGSISIESQAATAGTPINVKVTPGEGCSFQKLKVYKLSSSLNFPMEKDLLFEQNTLDPIEMPDELFVCIVAHFSTPEGIEEQQADAKLKITTDGRNLTISPAQAGVVEILSASGQLLLKESHDGSFQFAAPQPGLYIVKARLADGSTVVRKVMAN